MNALDLPFAPGSATSILHPINILYVSRAILKHALSSLNPDTAVVRRVHRHHRSSRAPTSQRDGGDNESQGVADTASVASSRGTHRSNRTVTASPVAASIEDHASVNVAPHRHHRTRSDDGTAATAASTRHRRHRTTSQDTPKATATLGEAPSTARRARSADDPQAVAARQRHHRSDNSEGNESKMAHRSSSAGARTGGRVRRSHSDGTATGQLSEGEGGTTPRLSASHPLSPAAVAAASSGLTPPLAPPPPGAAAGLGKPPLGSGRQRSSSRTSLSEGGPGGASRPHRHHRRSGSGSDAGLSGSGRSSSRSRRGDEGRNDDDNNSDAPSVIVISEGHWGSAAVGTGQPFSWSPRAWWRRVRAVKVTRVAYLMDHVLHAVPVALVHYCCELKRQLATLPLLRFSDLDVPQQTAEGSAAWLPTEEAFEQATTPQIGNLLFRRWMLHVVESYIQKFFFLDETIVVRQLRSKRTLRRAIGWSLRLLSHTAFDPFLLSIVVPLLLQPFAFSSSAAQTPRVFFTVPGLLRGLGVSAAGVTIERLVMPTASMLVDRAVLTMFEVMEYLIMRRYAHWSESDSDDEEEDVEDELDLEEYGFDDDAASLASGASGATQQSTRNATNSLTADGRTRREQRRLLRAKRERRRQRERRRAARDQAMRRTILRAILYRVVATVAAQCLVDHPLSVLVELLRGRATLHLTGLLAPYVQLSRAADALSWSNLWRYVSHAVDAPSDSDGVPPIVAALRHVGLDMAREIFVISSSVLQNSGQAEAMAVVERRAAETVAQGGIPTAADSAEFLARSALSLSPLYYGIQFTVIDKLLSFYMAVWTRLTKQ